MRSLLVAASLAAAPAFADVPRVVTDIPPVASLVAQVMDGVGTPDVLLEEGASPHHFAMRPSDARTVEQSQLVVWMGPDFSTWLADPLTSLASGAATLTLLETKGWDKRPNTEEHEHHDDHAGDGAHSDHHHDHDNDHDGGHHDHGEFDPHAWLDTDVASAWLTEIAEALAKLDPDNAALYRGNADKARTQYAALDQEIRTQLTGTTRTYLLPHDAYGYFIDRYDLGEFEIIADGHGQKPGAAHITELREVMASGEVSCVFTDLETNASWIDLINEGSDLPVMKLDIMGWDQPEGPERHPALLRAMAQAFANCR